MGEAPVTSGTAHISTTMFSSGSRQLQAIFVPDPLSPYGFGLTSIATQTVNTVASALFTPFAPTLFVLGGVKRIPVAKGDFDGDGKMDIAASRSGAHISLFISATGRRRQPRIGSPFQQELRRWRSLPRT